MSATWTQHVNPVVEQWLGKPIVVGEPDPNPDNRCSICGKPNDDLTGGWAGPWDEAVWVEVGSCCRGEGDE
jgi:hypothetical protein